MTVLTIMEMPGRGPVACSCEHFSDIIPYSCVGSEVASATVSIAIPLLR
jgi:hypothetical protein